MDKLDKELVKYEDKVSEESLSEAEKTAVKFRNDSRISAMWDRIQMMFEIAKHPKIWGAQVALWVGAALIYLVSPLDIIPDILPVVGLSDDIAALLLVLNRVSSAVRKMFQKDPEFYLKMFPEKLRPVVIKCFDLQVLMPQGSADVGDDGKKKLTLYFNTFLFGSRMAYKCAEIMEAEKEKGRTKSLKYRLSSFILKNTENSINWAIDAKFNDRIQASLDLSAERKLAKSLLSLVCVVFALVSYSLTPYSDFWVYAAGLFMAGSYVFVILGILKVIKWVFVFLIGSSRIRRAYPDFSFIDAGVSAVVSDMTEIKKPMIKDILDEVRANPHLRSMILRVVYRFFNTSLLRGVLKIGLMAVIFFILRRITLSLGYGADVMSILLAPITMAAGRVRQL